MLTGNYVPGKITIKIYRSRLSNDRINYFPFNSTTSRNPVSVSGLSEDTSIAPGTTPNPTCMTLTNKFLVNCGGGLQSMELSEESTMLFFLILFTLTMGVLMISTRGGGEGASIPSPQLSPQKWTNIFF